LGISHVSMDLALWKLIAAVGLILGLAAPSAHAQTKKPDLILRGALTRADHETYREIPFRLPQGTTGLRVEFEYSGQADRTVIDLGLRDPHRFRGWSGGAKSSFVIGDAFATPSYLVGPLPPGIWRLVLGVPNLRIGKSASYEARVWFETTASFDSTSVNSTPGWYRGDLHLHTGHSDGTCGSRKGARVPCPVFKTLEAAVARGLDFVAITDHNATSQNSALQELSPYYDDLLIVPGRELTTFKGHANVFGPVGPIDFQLGGPLAPVFDTILDQVEKVGGLISVNHPALPSGENCMGCGWTNPNTDWSRIQGLEVINGGALALLGAEGPLSGIPFWERLLDQGYQITAIGGSDNHDPTRGPSLGIPATVVHAQSLSLSSILTAIRRGHVFVDVWGGPDTRLEVTASAEDQRGEMGDALRVQAGQKVLVSAAFSGFPEGARLVMVGDGAKRVVTQSNTAAGSESLTLEADGRAHWLRFDVRGSDGKLLALGNPIYLRPAKSP
jgi:hypothetical protein